MEICLFNRVSFRGKMGHFKDILLLICACLLKVRVCKEIVKRDYVQICQMGHFKDILLLIVLVFDKQKTHLAVCSFFFFFPRNTSKNP